MNNQYENDEGFYFTASDLEKLLKANMYNPKGIEYIAEMVNDHDR